MTVQHTTSIERDPARLNEALPWYVNGTLSGSDRAWVEQVLAEGGQSGASARGHIEFDRHVCTALEQKLAQVPADIGWAGLVRQVRADAAAQPEVRHAHAQEAAFARRPADDAEDSWLRRRVRIIASLMSPQVGMAMGLLVAAQAIAIGVLVSEGRGGGSETVEYRTSGDTRPVAVIRALFDESITEKVLREALTANDASIIDGPNRVGEYWIVTDSRDPDAVAASLRTAGVIASYVIDHRPVGR